MAAATTWRLGSSITTTTVARSASARRSFRDRSTKNTLGETFRRRSKGTIDEDRFEQLRQTRCLAFKPGKKKIGGDGY